MAHGERGNSREGRHDKPGIGIGGLDGKRPPRGGLLLDTKCGEWRQRIPPTAMAAYLPANTRLSCKVQSDTRPCLGNPCQICCHWPVLKE